MFLAFASCAIYQLSANDRINPITADLPKINTNPFGKSEIAQLDDLIAATERSLSQQKSLRDLLIKYQETQTAYLNNEENVELLYNMINLAQKALKTIQENHLTHSFEPSFLNELNLFAQMANKRGNQKS